MPTDSFTGRSADDATGDPLHECEPRARGFLSLRFCFFVPPVRQDAPLRVTGGSGYYFAPSINFGPNENTTYSLGLTYEKNQGTGTGFNISYRKRF